MIYFVKKVEFFSFSFDYSLDFKKLIFENILNIIVLEKGSIVFYWLKLINWQFCYIGDLLWLKKEKVVIKFVNYFLIIWKKMIL